MPLSELLETRAVTLSSCHHGYFVNLTMPMTKLNNPTPSGANGNRRTPVRRSPAPLVDAVDTAGPAIRQGYTTVWKPPRLFTEGRPQSPQSLNTSARSGMCTGIAPGRVPLNRSPQLSGSADAGEAR